MAMSGLVGWNGSGVIRDAQRFQQQCKVRGFNWRRRFKVPEVFGDLISFYRSDWETKVNEKNA